MIGHWLVGTVEGEAQRFRGAAAPGPVAVTLSAGLGQQGRRLRGWLTPVRRGKDDANAGPIARGRVARSRRPGLDSEWSAFGDRHVAKHRAPSPSIELLPVLRLLHSKSGRWRERPESRHTTHEDGSAEHRSLPTRHSITSSSWAKQRRNAITTPPAMKDRSRSPPCQKGSIGETAASRGWPACCCTEQP